MSDLSLNGIYTIRKKDKIFNQKNNLTPFGILQIARFLKRDVYFSNSKNLPFGNIRSYSGRYKKISVRQGAKISFPQISGYQKIQTVGVYQNVKTIIDNEYSTYEIMSFTPKKEKQQSSYNNNKYCFDIDFSRSIHLGKVGFMFKALGSTDRVQNGADCTDDWTFFVKPQGVSIEIPTKVGDGIKSELTTDLQGDYIRVYNHLKPTFNDKPYYIKKFSKLSDVGSRNNYFYYALLYYNNAWGVFDISNDINNKSNTKTITIEERLTNIINVSYPLLQFSNLDLKQTNIAIANLFGSYLQNGTQTTISVNFSNCCKHTWLNAVNRLYNYMSGQENNKRYFQILNDIGIKYYINKGDVLNANTSMDYDNNGSYSSNIQYSKNKENFDKYLTYNTYTFESLLPFQSIDNSFQPIDNLYNLNIDQNFDDIKSCNENWLGFIPFVQSIRIERQNIDSNEPRDNIMFFGIDIFEKCFTPYNPIKIALTQNLNGEFNENNSWFVDDIQKTGDNKIVFTKQLQQNQAVTISEGFKYIALYGNFDGHLNGTLPSDVVIKENNCFSKAEFATPWTKSGQQSVIITYQLSFDQDNVG